MFLVHKSLADFRLTGLAWGKSEWAVTCCLHKDWILTQRLAVKAKVWNGLPNHDLMEGKTPHAIKAGGPGGADG